MRAKILTLNVLSIFIVAMLAVFVSAATLAEWSLTTNGVAINVDSDVNAGNLAFGSSLTNTGFDATDGATATGWNLVSLGANDYYEVTLSPNSGFDLTINTVSFDQVSNDSTTNMSFDVEWSTDGFTNSNNIGSAVVSTISSTSFSDTSTINVAEGKTFSLRVFGYGSDNSSTETFSVKNLILDGTVTAIPPVQTEPQEVIDCKAIKNLGDLKVKDIDFNNLGILIFQESSGDIYKEFGDDNEWFLLDHIEVEIEIEAGNFDIDDIEVEWGIYNTKTNKIVIEFEDEKDFNLRDGKDEIITVSFQLEDDLDIDLDELGDGKNFRFYVTATGTIDDSKSLNDGEDTCASDSEKIEEIVIENDFVILTDVQYPETVQCGENVQISAKVWNIGDDDQDEVKVEVHNNDLGLFHKTTEIGDIDEFDDDVYNFNFKVPNDAEEKTHSLRFEVLDEDFDVYENDFDDDESAFTLPFRVSGGCAGVVEKLGVSVSANIESGGKAGEELVVRATVTNNDDELQVFTVNAVGFSQWASSFTVDRTSLVLASGASADVRFTFDVNKDASGSQSFMIELVSEDNQVTTQPVSVAIEKRSGLFGGLTGAASLGNNAYLWGIGIINVILVLVIIIVAVRVLRK